MQLAHILPILVALPFSAFAESDSLRIRPFVEYGINLAGTSKTECTQNGHDLIKTDNFSFNNNNSRSFIFGIEIDDIMAISLNASINNATSKIHVSYFNTNSTQKSTKLDTKFDIYLTRDSNFKPFVSLSAGYLNVGGTYEASGALFGFGIGCKQYITDTIYVGANLIYDVSTKMHADKVYGLDVEHATMRVSGFDVGINAGYRF